MSPHEAARPEPLTAGKRNHLDTVRELVRVTAERDALRDATRALIVALETHGVDECEECSALALRVLTWESNYAYLCDRHAREQLAGEDPAPLAIEDQPVAAPFRALRALLGRPL